MKVERSNKGLEIIIKVNNIKGLEINKNAKKQQTKCLEIKTGKKMPNRGLEMTTNKSFKNNK